MFNQKKKKQHYIWRRYLKSWLVEGSLACMRDKKRVFSTKDLMNVGQQSYFYKVNSLTEQDINYVRDLFLSDVSEPTNAIFERLFSLFLKVEQVENFPSDGSHVGIENLKKYYANNLEEEIQSEIELQGDPCLTQLLAGDTSFFNNEKSAAHFLNYICMQYLRTKKHHDALVSGANSEQIKKCANLIRIVFSSKLAANLYANRSNYKLVIAKNNSDIPFITCDQPVVNFLDTRLDSSEGTEEFGLYYPISPNLAVFLVKNEIFGSVTEMSFDQLSVERFNQITFNASYEQVYSSSEKQLKDLVTKS
ncbi:DUF4238 domain-containing protein [Photobacterium damselae]|uniref:DUF4238 domain-containing protein n=1 Tax=Photobacterium damselae TaxID=38293 RepID=UPI001EFD1E0B|nr:DUF4238 domain-containing protein [Photobacterium damselae]MCG9705082.1 DUF4238 domain-containing protein [Photobacterium damselae]